MKGFMVWRGTRMPVLDVVYEPKIDERGVRPGWIATTDDIIASRMFYPEDMFDFEEAL